MKNITQALVAFGAVLVATTAGADGYAVFDGGWRISAGAVYDFGAKATGRIMPRQGYVSPYRAGMSKEEAQRKAQGTKTSETRTDFFDSGAWIDEHDGANGEDNDKTWYYKFPASTLSGNTFTLGSAEYSDVDTTIPAAGAFDRSFSDESGMLGVNVELSRNLYHDEEYGWGVDAAIGFQYFKHNGLLGIASSWFNGSSTMTRGSMSSTLTSSDVANPMNLKPEGYYGTGGRIGADGDYYDEDGDPLGAAPVKADIDMESFETSESDASYGSMRADGDYENMELMLLGRPYYDVFDWLRVNATFGLVVSRQDLDFEMAVLRDGVGEYSSHRDFSQWDVYGVAGLGLMLYYKDFTLSADFLARFLDDDLTFEDRYIQGEVQRGRWMFKLSAGYEF